MFSSPVTFNTLSTNLRSFPNKSEQGIPNSDDTWSFPSSYGSTPLLPPREGANLILLFELGLLATQATKQLQLNSV